MVKAVWAGLAASILGLGASAAWARSPGLPALAGPEAPPLARHGVLDQVAGHLNGDPHLDLVVAYRGQPDQGARPCIVFWGKAGGGWASPWLRSDTVLPKADEGGMLGDPLEKLAIEQGSLVVRSMGGAGWAWSTTERYALRGDTMRLVGLTTEGWHRGDPEGTRSRRDANLLTRLVEASGAMGPRHLRRQAYYELWAPEGQAWGPETRVLTRPFVRQGAAQWSGPGDASFSLQARLEGERLWVQAKVSDDRPTQGDRLSLYDEFQKEVPLRRQGAGQGPSGLYWVDARALGLAKATQARAEGGPSVVAHSDLLLRATWVFRDEDPGQGASLLATSQHPAAPGLVRLNRNLAPRWDEGKDWVHHWAMDDDRFSQP